jgi:hypothetical protein
MISGHTMMRAGVVLGLVVLGWMPASMAWAQDAARFRSVDPRSALCPTPRVVETFVPAPAGRLAEGVIVGTIKTFDGTVHVAFDGRPGVDPQMVIFDFTGAGDFKKTTTARINPLRRGPSFWGELQPVQVPVERNGQRFSVGVAGSIYRSGDRQSLDLQMGVMLSSRCTFGQRQLTIDIIDGDQNLHFGDKTVVNNQNFDFGDTLIIHNQSGATNKVLFGQPVCVEGAWYDLNIGADYDLTATPVELQTGELKIKHTDWSAILVGEKYVLGLSGDARPLSVPADTYRVARYEERMGTAGISCQGKSDKSVTIVAGQEQELEIGSPIAGLPVLHQKGDQVIIRARLVDVSGLAVSELRLPNGRRPPPPVVAIFDAQGRQLYTATLEYG